jgi:putative ABC transport system ATP-binding protein
VKISAIQLDGVGKSFRSGTRTVDAIKDLTCRIDVGETVVIRGPSGSGKTTLLNIIGCLSRPTAGSVTVGGREVASLPDHLRTRVRRQQVGFIFQQFNLLPGYSTLDNVAMPLVPLGLGTRARRERARHFLDELGIAHRAEFAVNELSGGEQQRVAIARALINDPWLVLADEPTSNVDDESARAVLAIFERLRSKKKTLVLSSHDPQLLTSGLVDRTLMLPEGRWQDGDPPGGGAPTGGDTPPGSDTPMGGSAADGTSR